VQPSRWHHHHRAVPETSRGLAQQRLLEPPADLVHRRCGVPHTAVREAAQQKSGPVHLPARRRSGGLQAKLAVRGRQDVQDPVDLDQLDQEGVAERGEELVEIEPRHVAGRRAGRPQNPCPHRDLQPAPFPLQNAARGPGGVVVVQAAGGLA
jgi:hypothetical protein